jgi:XrtN system VIT domain protein
MQTITEAGGALRRAEPEKAREPIINIQTIGYFTLTLSAGFYSVCEYLNAATEDNVLMLFVLHYLAAIVYIFFLVRDDAYGITKSWRKENIHKTIVLLNLFLVSAYALNRTMYVFHDSTAWLCVYLVTTSLMSLTYRFYDRVPKWAQAALQFLLGSAIVFYAYLILYVTPFYGFGFVGILLVGVGAHIFVPLTLMIGVISLARHTYRQYDKSFYWIVVGSVVTIGYAALFAGEWSKRIEKVSDLYNQSVMYPNAELPPWLSISQTLKPDWITVRILKSDLVYTTSSKEWDFLPQGLDWAEEKKHDPLVFIGSWFAETSVPREERKQILKAIFNNRHEAEDRLWMGSNLSTAYVVSDVDIYPDLRLAYTEKYLTIRNSDARRFRNSQEAIYTFQLPEGSVVTSLSLWINGKEEKGILTTKGKATQAYNTIVGVEQRDPSVIHWQEGNQVTVRVFPCTPDEERKVKIGITSPLLEEDGQLKLSNISFAGPDFNNAKETYRVRFLGAAENITLPDHFKKDAKGNYIAEQAYDPDFAIAFATVPLKPNQFTFGNYSYSIRQVSSAPQKFKADNLYLDINNTWTDAELATIKSFIPWKNVMVYLDHEFIKLREDNFQAATDQMKNHNFSLFPFHHLPENEGALVITKGSVSTPHLSDLTGTVYSDRLQKYFGNKKKVKVFNLKGGTAAYISSLREMRGLEYASGTADELTKLIKTQQFNTPAESDESVTLHDAGLAITRTRKELSTMKDNAPDHLARLFAYNNIMRKAGPNYFTGDYANDELIKEASAAYIVSPVSSLIVLETQEDYKRFDIEHSKNSLQNASKQSSGAVPEPHEWALIILSGLVMVYLKVRR